MTHIHTIIIGTGRAGQARIKAAQALPMVSSVETLSVRKHGITGIRSYLQSSPGDIAIICAENSLHGVLIKEALEQKMHVLVEFPLVTSSAEAEKLWAMSNNHNLQLCCSVLY